jgi:hypothetical protein
MFHEPQSRSSMNRDHMSFALHSRQFCHEVSGSIKRSLDLLSAESTIFEL